MGLPFADGFDGVTAPALPSGYNATGTGWATTTSDFASSPNSATISTSSASKAYLVWGAADGNGGDVVLQCKIKDFSAVRPGTVGLVARGSASTLDATTSQYELGLNWNTGALRLSRVNAGTATALATVTIPSGWDQWDTLKWTLSGSTHTIELQRSSDSQWLTSAGSWQVAETAAITFTDSSPLTGSGFFGLFSQAGSSSSHQGWWDDFSATAPGSATTIYFADSGSGLDLSLETGLGGESAAGADATLLRRLDPNSSSGGDLSLVSRALADAGSAASASIVTALAFSSIYTPDGAIGSEGSILARLIADATAEAESYLETFVLVGEDIAAGDGFGLPILLAGESTPLLDPIWITQTAPAPTAWAIDSASSFAATLAFAYAGTTGSAGSLDSATGLEGWSLATTLIGSDAAAARLDSARASEAWRSFAIVTYAGYHVYENTGVGDPIDYDSYAAEIVGLSNTTWTSPRLSPGTWSFGVRAFSPNGEEQNVDVAVTIAIAAGGSDVSNIPDPPRALSAVAQGGGKVAVHWLYPIVSGPVAPAGFRVYKGTGGIVDYSTPVATAQAGTTGTIGRYTATVSGLADRVGYTFGVRAFNATGEEANLSTTSATARATGPDAVQSLTIQASA